MWSTSQWFKLCKGQYQDIWKLSWHIMGNQSMNSVSLWEVWGVFDVEVRETERAYSHNVCYELDLKTSSCSSRSLSLRAHVLRILQRSYVSLLTSETRLIICKKSLQLNSLDKICALPTILSFIKCTLLKL